MIFLLAPMSASAADQAIWVNERGNVEMTKATFMAREKDLLRLEAKTQKLKEVLQEERESTDEYIARMKDLEKALETERQARKEAEIQTWAEKVRWGLVGLGIGVIVGIAID